MLKLSSTRVWDALTPPLAEWILDAVSSMGFQKMTPVQASTIPLFMGHKDVVVEAVTGSGKTLAFLIPIIERLLRLDEPVKKHHVAAIVISPTRELASQIHQVLLSVLNFHGPSAASLEDQSKDNETARGVDGTYLTEHTLNKEVDDVGPSDPQEWPASTLKVVPQLLVGGSTTPKEDLKYFLKHSPNLLVSTPGRLLEVLSSPRVNCSSSSFEVLVMDEADRLLDLGFEEDLRKILNRLPKQRRTGLFSASVSEAVDQIIRVGLRNPVKIAVKVRSLDGKEEQRTPASLQMKYLILPASQHIPAVSKLLRALTPTPSKAIIYLSTCAAVDYFQHIFPSILSSNDTSTSFNLVPLHGKHPPSVRTKNFSRFTNAATPTVLLTTDVAARGLDIPQVDLVIQLDAPTDAKVFLHRCGRAGRAGRKGLSVVFLKPGREEEYIDFLSIRKTPVSPLTDPSISMTADDVTATTDTMRKVVLSDRAIFDKAQRAFPSWVQAYRKHTASSIFDWRDLDWTDLAQAWALLRLPRMPELKKWEGDPKLGLEIDFEEYAYKDKAREKQRREKLELSRRAKVEGKKEEGEGAKGGDKAQGPRGEKRAWSQKIEQKEERVKRREMRQTKREKIRWEKMTPEQRREKLEVDAMVEEVKRRRLAQEDGDQAFEGFSD